MDRRALLGASLGLFALPVAARAQQTGKVHRTGVLLTAAAHEAPHLRKALDDGLRDLGYVEGRNIVVEGRFAGGRQEQLPALAAELVRLNVDVIVAGSNPVIAALKQRTSTIPIVMPVSRDPVAAGFGGNITGLSNDPAPRYTPRAWRS